MFNINKELSSEHEEWKNALQTKEIQDQVSKIKKNPFAYFENFANLRFQTRCIICKYTY